MAIQLMNKDKMVWCCECGVRTTYNFNCAGVNTKIGPFSLEPGQTLTFRFDNTAGYAGVIETITFNSGDFPEWTSIPASRLADKLNKVLKAGKAFDDYGTVLVESCVSGEKGCVEVIDGTAREALGYDMRGGAAETVHHCCERLCMGYSPTKDRVSVDTIVLRRCNSCGGQTTLTRNRIDFSASNTTHPSSGLHRRAVNSLAQHLIKNGWVDANMVDYFAKEKHQPTEFLKDFPDKEVQLFKHEDRFPNKK